MKIKRKRLNYNLKSDKSVFCFAYHGAHHSELSSSTNLSEAPEDYF